ncbi:uncharacterized protein E1O_04820 [Burkholderiales bacterium GJ-E10]|nr:uncharacterized protein E1O_04820 [Burkholderiales bacterium GJ-E10]
MKRHVTFAIAAAIAAIALTGCGNNSGTGKTAEPAAQPPGPSPYAGHDKAWFDSHLKERTSEIHWCNTNSGYVNPFQPSHRANQAKTWDPACDAASDSWNAAQRNAKTGPGAF